MTNRKEPPTEDEYAKARASIAIEFAPPIYACKKCGWPVVSGYCCDTCGDTSPYSTAEEETK